MFNHSEMTAEELEMVRKYHDAQVAEARLELRAESVRGTCPPGARAQMSMSAEAEMRELDAAIVEMSH